MMADPESGFECAVACKHSVSLGDDVQIMDLIKGDSVWVAVDKQGKLWKFSEDFVSQEQVMEFHSGKIVDLAAAPLGNAVVTLGADCSTRLWDIVGKTEVYCKKWVGHGQCLDWAPPDEFNDAKVLAVGFDNGIVRMVYLSANNFELLGAWKVHDEGVVQLKFSPNGKYLASAGADNSLFFFEVKEACELVPVCITPIGASIKDLCWHESSDRLLLALHNGKVSELNRPDRMTLDTSHSYEVAVPQKL